MSLNKALSEESLAKQPDEVFDVAYQLGSGSFGCVFKAIHKVSGKKVAIKKVPVDADLQEIINEISILQQCDSPYVVRYFGSYFQNSDLWIIMEYCEAGSLSDIMHLSKKCFTEAQIATVLQDALKGLDYLHKMNKLHRDIKAANILLNTDGLAKLADFGVAGHINEVMCKANTVTGSPFWMAPEMLQEVGYDYAADVWSLGITAIEIAEGKPPYSEIHPMRAMFMIPKKPPPTFSNPKTRGKDFVDFVNSCLVKDPLLRMSVPNLLKHRFLKRAGGSTCLRPIINEVRRIRLVQYSQKEAAAAFEQSKVIGSVNPGPSTSAGASTSSAGTSTGTSTNLPTFVIHGDATLRCGTKGCDKKDCNYCSFLEGKSPEEVKAFMEKMDEIKSCMRTPIQLGGLGVDVITERFKLLDLVLERELHILHDVYLAKKAPIEKAIQNKRENTRNF